MYHINAFIVEIPFLIQRLQSATNTRFNIEYFNKLNKTFKERLKITFGIFNETIINENTLKLFSTQVSSIKASGFGITLFFIIIGFGK